MSEQEDIAIDILSVREKAYLGALLHTSRYKKNVSIDFTRGIPLSLAPTYAYGEKMCEVMLKRRILVKAKGTRARISLYDPCPCMLYSVNIQDIEQVLPELMYPSPLTGEGRREAFVLLQEIRLHEALEYMQDTLQKFHLRVFHLDPRYIQLFLQILKSYSLGQLFNFIYTAVRDQAAYMQRDSNTYVPLENYIYKKIIDRFERAEVKGWNIIHFDRAWGWQQSELSKLVCGRLLDIPESTLHKVIDEHL